MDEDRLRLRLAVRSIFEACFPGDDFEKAEAERFPRYASALAAAEAVLQVRSKDMPERRHLSASDVAFEIRYALGQAPASLYVDARSKDRTKRDHALEQLVQRVALRFAATEMSYALRPGWHEPPSGGVQAAPHRPE